MTVSTSTESLSYSSSSSFSDHYKPSHSFEIGQNGGNKKRNEKLVLVHISLYEKDRKKGLTNSAKDQEKHFDNVRDFFNVYNENQNVVLYCHYLQKYPQFRKSFLRLDAKILWNEDYVSESLHAGRYYPFLLSIWGQGRPSRKIEEIAIFEKKHGDLHAPLMFEKALWVYKAAPQERKIETVKTLCYPLLSSAKFRCQQDVKCAKDVTVPEKYKKIIVDFYYGKLTELIKQDFSEEAFDEIGSDLKVADLMADAIQKTARKTLNAKTLPKPDWIAGFNEMGASYRDNLLSEEKQEQRRRQYASKFCESIS